MKIQINFKEKNIPGHHHLDRRFQDQWQNLLSWWEVLSRDEWTLFQQFIVGFGRGASQQSLYIVERIRQALVKNTNSVNGSQLFTKCFPDFADASFENKLKKLGRELKFITREIQQFLIQQEMRSETQIQKRLLIKGLKRRKNTKLFKLVLQEWEENMHAHNPTLMLSLDQWWAVHQNYYHLQTEHFSTEHALFAQVLQSFDHFRQIVIMRNYVEWINRNHPVTDASNPLIDQLVRDANAILLQATTKLPLVELYCALARFLTDENLDCYPVFVTLYLQHNAKINKVDHIVFVTTIINFFHRRHKLTKEEQHYRRVFAWMLQAKRHDLFYYEGTVSDANYLNFFTVACRLNKYGQYEDFAKRYGQYLEPSSQQLVMNWCQVKLLFEHQKYAEAREQLIQFFPLYSKLETKYDFRIKGLRVMVNYHCKTLNIKDSRIDEELSSSILNLEQYSRRMIRKKMNVHEAHDHLNFLKVVKALYSFQKTQSYRRKLTSLKAIQIKRIIQIYQHADSIVYRPWLGSQIKVILDQNQGLFSPFMA